MAVKKNQNGRAKGSVGEQDILRDVLGLHFQASRRVDELLEEAESLRQAGKLRQANTCLRQAAGVRKGLRSLEADVSLRVRAVK